MTTLPPVITKDDATKVLAHVGHPDYPATLNGGFYTALLEAIFRADRPNLYRLAAAFPGLCAARAVYGDVEGGQALLVELAAS